MRSIVLICPYFGKLPNYFPLVLSSMSNNPTINWLIFTDDKSSYHYPDNVKVVQCNFLEVQRMVKKTFPYLTKVDKPYKLCDYRPFYGLIFKKYIKEYDFWGYCDFDCIFGNIRNFLTNKVLMTYDKILFLGHFSLYSNSKKIEQLILDVISTSKCKQALQLGRCSFQLDEIMVPGYLMKKGIKIYSQPNMIADICCTKKPFKICDECLREIDGKIVMNGHIHSNDGLIFLYKNGTLIGMESEKDIIKKREYMYIHLQKRHMSCDDMTMHDFIITPNEFRKCSQIKPMMIYQSMSEPYIYFQHWKISWHYRWDPIKRELYILKHKIFNVLMRT